MSRLFSRVVAVASFGLCSLSGPAYAGTCGARDYGPIPESIEPILGTDLVIIEGSHLKPTTIPEGRKYVVLSFGASWCPPCRTFTSYAKTVSTPDHQERLNYSYIFVSMDKKRSKMLDYARRETSQWLTFPTNGPAKHRAMLEGLVKSNDARITIPAMIVLDLQSQKIVCSSIQNGVNTSVSEVYSDFRLMLRPR